MNIALMILFWGTVLILGYTFILFPAWVLLRGRLFPRPYHSAEITPSVSLVIAAYNEAGTIENKIKNILALDYPKDCLEVIIASDGSTDDTEKIIGGYSNQGIKLLSLPRLGKNPVLTEAALAATGDILIFSDANSIFAPDAIRALVKPFADPSIGGVAGNQCYLSSRKAAPQASGEQTYWDFDRIIKRYENRGGNVISATGSIYAIRRCLFQPIAPGLVDDFIASTGVIVQGYRLVFVEEARSFEKVAHSQSLEFNRKVRITLQGLKSIFVRQELLNPFRYGFYAIQLLSHKVLRRLAVFPLLGILIISPFLWKEGLLYQLAFLGQVAFYGCAVAGFLLSRKKIGRLKLFTIPFYFTMVYAAALLAVIKLLRGHEINQWETPQREAIIETSTR